MFTGKTILITGGTGSFGRKCTEIILKKYNPKRLIILSRDELKQFEMAQIFPNREYPCMRYFIGDVRDKERLYRAFHGVDYVIHAAALKQVPSAEYNPFEAVKTNILGAEDVINVTIDKGVKKGLALSTAGELLTKDNVRSIRPGYGLHPIFLKDILHKKSKKEIKKGTPLSWDLLI